MVSCIQLPHAGGNSGGVRVAFVVPPCVAGGSCAQRARWLHECVLSHRCAAMAIRPPNGTFARRSCPRRRACSHMFGCKSTPDGKL